MICKVTLHIRSKHIKLWCLLYMFLLLAGSASAGQKVVYEIDCPYLAITNDTITFAESTNVDGVLHRDAGGISENLEGIGVHSTQYVKVPAGAFVVINVDTFVLKYDTSGSSTTGDRQAAFVFAVNAGVRLLGNGGSILCDNEGTAFSTTVAFDNPGDSGMKAYGPLTIANTGYNSRLMNLKNTDDVILCSLITFTQNSTAYATRHEVDHCVSIANGYGDWTTDTLLYMYDCVLTNCSHIGFNFSNFAVVLERCKVTGDAQNDSATAANAYGFRLESLSGGYMLGCKVTAAGHGIDGILIENVRGSSTHFELDSDTTIVFNGDNGETNRSFGLRIRGIETDLPRYWKNVWVHDCHFETIGDGDGGTDSLSPNITAAKITWSEFTADSSGGYFKFHDNVCIARSLTTTGMNICAAIELGMGNDSAQYGTAVVWDSIYNNEFYSSQYPVAFTDYENGIGDSGRIVRSSHLSHLPAGDSGAICVDSATVFNRVTHGTPRLDTHDNWLVDCTFGRGASDSSNAYAGANDHEHGIKYTLLVQVTDGVVGDSVYAITVHGDTTGAAVLSAAKTNYASLLLVTRIDSATNLAPGSFTEQDSVMNDFTIACIRSDHSDTTTATHTLTSTNKTAILEFAATPPASRYIIQPRSGSAGAATRYTLRSKT